MDNDISNQQRELKYAELDYRTEENNLKDGRISVVIPVYNEGRNIQSTLERCKQVSFSSSSFSFSPAVLISSSTLAI